MYGILMRGSSELALGFRLGEVEVLLEPTQDLRSSAKARRDTADLLFSQEDKQFRVAHHVSFVVDDEIVDQLLVIFIDVSDGDSQVSQQRRYFFYFGLEMGAVTALSGGSSTQEAENMTSQRRGSA
jgi:hypothetical protein